MFFERIIIWKKFHRSDDVSTMGAGNGHAVKDGRFNPLAPEFPLKF